MKGEFLKVNHERYPQRAGGKTKSYEVAVDCRFVEVAGNDHRVGLGFNTKWSK